MSLTEPELIMLLRQGDDTAFSRFVALYADVVFNTLFSLVQNREDAEDLAQDTFVSAFQSIGSFAGDAKLSTWLYRIAVNKGLEHLRKVRRKKRSASLFSFFGPSHAEPVADFHHPGVAAERKEDAALLFHAVKQLPEKQQTAFLLNKTEGLSYAEIAEILSCSESAVDSLLQRARQNLKKILEKTRF